MPASGVIGPAEGMGGIEGIGMPPPPGMLGADNGGIDDSRPSNGDFVSPLVGVCGTAAVGAGSAAEGAAGEGCADGPVRLTDDTGVVVPAPLGAVVGTDQFENAAETPALCLVISPAAAFAETILSSIFATLT
ncbi:hypothetical protein A5751_24625 [Mycolicibacterium fortuitum]|nr:hypothetical protein A5751_24625 [Mycolicibacterium fortuitum]